MIIPFSVNSRQVSLDLPPEKRLVDVLREDLGLLKTKARCYAGECGFCTVLFNDEVQLSCLIPAFSVKNSTVVTIEGFQKTTEYQDIIKGFSQVQYKPCEYCEAGKIMATYALLRDNPNPLERDILQIVDGNLCRCTDINLFIQAVRFAAFNRRKSNHDR
jgi:carbon-monoxide dehydrogenase small subunit